MEQFLRNIVYFPKGQSFTSHILSPKCRIALSVFPGLLCDCVVRRYRQCCVGRTGRQGNVLQDGWMAVSSSIMIGLQGSKWCFIDVAMTTLSKRWEQRFILP